MIASSKGAALALLRRELGVKRLPNAADLVELEEHNKRHYAPPFRHEKLEHYDHNKKSLAFLRDGNLKGAKEACDKRETWLVLDSNDKIVCGKNTEQDAIDYTE